MVQETEIAMEKLYRQRGRVGRCKKKPVMAGGLWNRLQANPVQQGEFSIQLLQEVFGDLFYGKKREYPRPIRIQIWSHGKSQKAANRKSMREYKKFAAQIPNEWTPDKQTDNEE